MKIPLYALTVFLSSALLLALEIVAGRLIAPYVGVSLYTWTAIIGVILAGLSVGNWIGGVWADRGAGEKNVAYTLLGAGITSFSIPLLLTLVAPSIQNSDVNLLTASLLLVLSLFFLPAVLLGIVTPLLTTLALQHTSRPGHIIGMMHALAAIGSILGTFVTGYWLIQYFGTRNVILGTSAVLSLLALPLLSGKKTKKDGLALPLSLLIFSLVLIGTFSRQGFDEPCDKESQYFCIRVLQEPWDLPPGTLKSMVLDHLLHGVNHSSEPALLVSPYVHLMDELITLYTREKPDSSLFFIGGGAYTLPRAIQSTNSQAKITVAELDPEVTRMAETDLYLNTSGMNIFHTDARIHLQKTAEKHDIIVGDAFHDIAIPTHLVTSEMAALIKSRLNEDGSYILNVVDAFPSSKMAISIMKTLKSHFNHVDAWLGEIPREETRVTYVISASDRPITAEQLYSQRGLNRQWYKVTHPLEQVSANFPDLPILTDDYAPVESLMNSLFLSDLGN